MTLLYLSLAGSITTLFVIALDRLLSRSMSTRWRRAWWIFLPLFFLHPPIQLAVIPAPSLNGKSPATVKAEKIDFPQNTESLPETTLTAWEPLLSFTLWTGWALGAIGTLIVVMVQTHRAARRWATEPLCIDSDLLGLLEDCKAKAGVTAPIGLVLSDHVASPALLGWLRPRILIPASLAKTLPHRQLRAILLHELAHFRHFDIPAGWLFNLVRAVHWFNPFAHLAAHAWARFREEAADETAIQWMQSEADDAQTYQEALLSALRDANKPSPSVPVGALAIGESIAAIKQRFIMIQNHPNRSMRPALGIAIALLLLTPIFFRPVYAEDKAPKKEISANDAAKAEAVKAMTSWLNTIDEGDYPKSWKNASKFFRTAVTEEQWIAACKSVRGPLGKLIERELVSALYQTEIPLPDGTLKKAKVVIAQFDASYENLDSARETVTFEQEEDGSWRASGYYVKPKL